MGADRAEKMLSHPISLSFPICGIRLLCHLWVIGYFSDCSVMGMALATGSVSQFVLDSLDSGLSSHPDLPQEVGWGGGVGVGVRSCGQAVIKHGGA